MNEIFKSTARVCSCLLVSPLLQAAPIYWDGGDGSWATLGKWSTASGAATPDPGAIAGSSDDAIFNITTANLAQNITLDGDQTVKSLTFNNTGTTNLRGNSSGTTARTLTIGSGGITLNSGAGAVTIGDTPATYGAVNITLGSAQSWTNSSTSLLTVTGAVANGGNLLTIGGTGNTTISGAITGTGGITKLGSGTVTLNSNSNSFSGALTISGGIFSLGVNLAGTASSAGNTGGITLNNGGTLKFGNGGVNNSGNRVSDSAAITSNGGKIDYANIGNSGNTYTETIGTVSLNTGHLVIHESANMTTSFQTLTISSLTHAGASNTSTISFVAATTGPQASGNRNMINFTTAPTLSSGIIGPWAVTGLLLSGNGTTGQADYATISGGYVVPLATTATITETDLATGSSYQTTNNGNINWGTANLTLAATRTLNTLRYTGTSAAALTFNGNNLETYGILIATGSGGGTLNQGTGSGFLTIPNSGDAALYLTAATRALTVNVAIKDNGSNKLTLVKSGLGGLTATGLLALTNTGNSYSGDTVVNQGDIRLDASGVIPDGAGKGNVILNGNGTGAVGDSRLLLNGSSETINGLSGNGAVQNSHATNASTLTVGNGDATSSFSGLIMDGGTATLALTKTGAGTQTLSGVNTYTGATTITGGKLSITSTGTINSTSSVSIAGGEFNYNSATALSKSVSFSGTGGKLSGSGTITPAVTVTSGNTLAPGNSIGTLSFGSGLTLSGTYSVELGTVDANPASSLSDRSVVTGGLTVGGNLTLVDNAGANGQGSAGAGAYRIATYTTTLSGTFASVTNPLSATLHEKVVYGPASGGGSVDLNLYRLATGSTADLNLGKARVGDTFSGFATVSNSAANDGFSENLNASVGSNTGDVNSSTGTVSGVIPGASNSTNISIGLTTATSGVKAGTATVGYDSDGLGTSGYGTTANGNQTVNVTGAVYDYASATFGGGSLVNNGGGSWTLDFGTVNQNDVVSASFNLYNLFVSTYQDALGGSLSYTGSGVFTDLTGAISQIAGGGSNLYNIGFDTTNTGVFGGTLTFNGLSQQSGLSDASLSAITLTVNGTVVAVPEPRAALLGGLSLLTLLRRRRN